jgi:hypothetical protein
VRFKYVLEVQGRSILRQKTGVYERWIICVALSVVDILIKHLRRYTELLGDLEIMMSAMAAGPALFD